MTLLEARPGGPTRAERWIAALLPDRDGAAHPFLGVVRTKASALLLGTVALAIGAAAGFLLVLLATGLPGLPGLAVGFAGGAVAGAAGALVVASRYPLVRRYGALVLVASPLLLLAAPFLWIGALVGLLGRTRPRRPAPPGAVEARGLARRTRRASGPRRRRSAGRDGARRRTAADDPAHPSPRSPPR